MHFLCSLLQIPAEQWRNDQLAIKLESGRRATEISGDGVGVLSEVQTWLRCPKALSSSMRSTVDWRQAGLRVAAALVTYGSARQASVLRFFPFFPRSPVFFTHHFLFSFTLSWAKPDHRHAADVMVAMVTEALQQRSCVEMVRSVKKVTMGHQCNTVKLPADAAWVAFPKRNSA